jgi:aspartate kinase
MDLIVCKFGGTSVATTERIRQIENILARNQARRCVVVSAPGKAPGAPVKVTDLLIAVTRKVLATQSPEPELGQVKDRYRAIFAPLGLSSETIEHTLSDLDQRVNSPTKQDPKKFRDLIVAAGEDLNARLFAAYLTSRGTSAVYASPAESGMIVTPDFGDAQPLPETATRLASLRSKCSEMVVVFPGFFGVTTTGEVATFSRGGSDLTGSILAEAIDATEYENWTDVDGIFSCNPTIVDKPVQIPALTYREMRELSYMGFNVLHEEAVRPTMRKNIPIRLRNTNNLDNAGTLIVAQRLPTELDVVGIAGRGGFCSFTLDKFLMNREKGFGRRLLSIFEDRGFSYEHCPSGVDNISVILEQSQLSPESVNAIVRTIQDELRPDNIKTEFNIALVAVVGEGLMHRVGMLARSAAALSKASVNIKMANQGSSEMSIIFGIDAEDEKKAVAALYGEFFK